MEAAINAEGRKTAPQLEMLTQELKDAQAKFETNVNLKYLKLCELKPAQTEEILQTKKNWTDAARLDLFNVQTDLAVAKDNLPAPATDNG